MKGFFFIDKEASLGRFNQLALAYNEQFYADSTARSVKWNGSRLLRKSHYDIFEIILFLLIRKNRTGEPVELNDLISISTSNREILNLYTKRLGKDDPFRPCNPSVQTVWRHIKRLVDAEVLTKTNIRGSAVFRLSLNLKSLCIYDLDKEKELSTEKGSQPSVCPEKIAKFKLNQSYTNREKGKNNTCAVDNKESGQQPDELKKTENRTKTGNTREVKKSGAADGTHQESFFAQQEKIKTVAQNEPDRYKRTLYQVERYKYHRVLKTYFELLSLVFTQKKTPFGSYGEVLDHNFTFRRKLSRLNHFTEHGDALKILLSYFARTDSYESVDQTANKIIKAAELSRRTILRKGYNTDYLTPTKYLRPGKISLRNVLKDWLPEYDKRQQQRIKKIESDQKDLQQVQQRIRFFTEADLLLSQISEGKSIAEAFRYISTFYPSVYRSWFENLLEQQLEGKYKTKIRKQTKEQQQFTQKVFEPESYIASNEKQLITALNGYMKKRSYNNALASAVQFKDPMVRANAISVKDLSVFSDFAYRKLMFS